MKLSLIIPAYKTAQYLPECLDSVLSQSLTDMEVICINDGSPDNALEIMQAYAAKDSRVIVVDTPNQGVGAARNEGMKIAQGEFIAFMDSDDYYPNSDVLSELYDAAIANNVNAAGGHYISVYPDGHQIETQYSFHDIDLARHGLCAYRDFQFDYGFWAYIYKREILQQANVVFPNYSRFQDPPFFVRAMLACNSFYALDKASYCYRQLPGTAKTSFVKTMAMLDGLMDNLQFSRKNQLEKLHFITATRLDEEGSYMVLQNLQDSHRNELVAKYLHAFSYVDVSWLKQQNCPLPEPFLPQAFDYAFDTAAKYERLRRNKFVRIIAKLLGR